MAMNKDKEANDKAAKDKEAKVMRQQLKDSADKRNTYIKKALAALSDADKASNKAVLEKTREIIKDTFRGEVSAKLATIITNGEQLQHINEYMDSIEATRATPFFAILLLLIILIIRGKQTGQGSGHGRRFKRGEVEVGASTQESAVA